MSKSQHRKRGTLGSGWDDETTEALLDIWNDITVQNEIDDATVSDTVVYKNISDLKTYAAISNAHLSRVCKRGKLSGSCLSTLNGFGSTQLEIFLCHIGVPTFSSQNN